jgi:carboxypeptidase C (cathepsin A)
MKFKLIPLLLLLGVTISFGQGRTLEPDHQIVTNHQVTIRGQSIPYTATAGTQPVWNEKGEVIASLFYTYYQRSDIKNKDTRPLVISFNGGPGSASVWMHLAYTGPKILKIDDEGYPIQPYGVKDNPHSILDEADIVFVNPVNTGYSRIIDHETKRETFFGVNADIKYLAEWINTFVTRTNRWASPKFLIGESYGTTRVSGLAHELQNNQWMFINGVILVSPTELGIERDGPVEAANRLPYFAAAAWYHKVLAAEHQNKELEVLLEEVEDFTINELLPAMAKGGFLPEEQKIEMAQKMAAYSGMSSKTILQHNLDVPTSFFWKDLLREKGGYTVGRLDSRYKGIDKQEAGVRPDYNSELDSWLHSFTPAINYYFKNHLNYQTEVKYNMFGPVHPWDRTRDRTGEQLRLAMAQNPYMKVMVQSGYFDGATTYFEAKYTLWQLDPSGKMKDRLRFEGYHSGHMMYLRAEDLKSSNEHLRSFIQEAIPTFGTPAKY